MVGRWAIGRFDRNGPDMPLATGSQLMSDSRPPTLRRNFSWTFLGNTAYAVSQWAMLVVLAKLGTPTMVGQFALALAVTSPVIIFARLELGAVLASDARREYQFSDYLGLRLVSMAAALAVIGTITLATSYPGEMKLLIMTMAAVKAVDAVSDICYALLQQRERMDRIATSMLIKGPLALAALTLAVTMTGSVLGGVVALAITSVVVLFTYDARSAVSLLATSDGPLRHPLRPRLDPGVLKKLGWTALPLGIATMLNELNTSIPRYLIVHYQGESALGIFAALAYLTFAGATVVNAMGQAAYPRLAVYCARADHDSFRSLLNKLMVMAALLGVGSIGLASFLGSDLLGRIYRPEYAGHAALLTWLMIAAALGYMATYQGYGLTASRNFAVQPFIFAGNSVMTAGLALLFIPRHGAIGAAWVAIIVTAIQLLVMGAFNALTIRRLQDEESRRRSTGAETAALIAATAGAAGKQ
jgi:O-antigen/teichoic acid export membrane protein